MFIPKAISKQDRKNLQIASVAPPQEAENFLLQAKGRTQKIGRD
jgi:hypothetical protein